MHYTVTTDCYSTFQLVTKQRYKIITLPRRLHEVIYDVMFLFEVFNMKSTAELFHIQVHTLMAFQFNSAAVQKRFGYSQHLHDEVNSQR